MVVCCFWLTRAPVHVFVHAWLRTEILLTKSFINHLWKFHQIHSFGEVGDKEAMFVYLLHKLRICLQLNYASHRFFSHLPKIYFFLSAIFSHYSNKSCFKHVLRVVWRSSVECSSEQCKQRRAELDSEIKMLRRELKARDEDVRQLELETQVRCCCWLQSLLWLLLKFDNH